MTQIDENEEALVSVIVPTFNRSNFLGETLDSVIRQTYTNWECIVVDDSSQDYTQELMEFYTGRDKRISFLSIPPEKKGAAACRNYALGVATGDFIQFLDSDDILHKDKLKAQLDNAKDRDSVFFCRWGYFSGNNFQRFKYSQHSYRSFSKPLKLLKIFGRYNEFLPIHSFLIPADVARITGPWNELLGNNDDAEYVTRILLNCKRLKYVPEAIVYYRVEGQNSLSGFDTVEQASSAVLSLKLIQGYLEKAYPRTCSTYLDTTRKNVLKKLVNFPEVIKQHESFFPFQASIDHKNNTK